MAIDLGTANTVVYVRGRGIVLSEPSVVAIDQRTGEVHAVGADAQLMIGRTPATISADRPLRHGVIADFEVTEAMLRQFVDKVLSSRFSRPRLVMCAPSGVTDVERRAVEEASLSAGAREVHLIEESLAAAIGAGLPIAEPVGRMVVDVGGGTSEVAVISLGGIVVSQSLRVGGYDLDDAITNHIRLEHRMAIGSQSAEAIKLAVGTAITDARRSSPPASAGATCSQAFRASSSWRATRSASAIDPPVIDIIAAVHATLEETPPELAADIATERDRPGRRRRAPARLRRPRAPRDGHARPHRRRSAHLRGLGRRPVARGARRARPPPRRSVGRLHCARAWRGGRVAEGTRLLSEYGAESSIAGSNPALSAGG